MNREGAPPAASVPANSPAEGRPGAEIENERLPDAPSPNSGTEEAGVESKVVPRVGHVYREALASLR